MFDAEIKIAENAANARSCPLGTNMCFFCVQSVREVKRIRVQAGKNNGERVVGVPSAIVCSVGIVRRRGEVDAVDIVFLFAVVGLCFTNGG